MSEVSGIVQATKQRDKGHSILVGDVWYSGWGTCPAVKGDRVKFTAAEESTTFPKYKDLTIQEQFKGPSPGASTSPGTSTPPNPSGASRAAFGESRAVMLVDREDTIVRSVALKCAATMSQGKDTVTITGVLDLAEDLVIWLKTGRRPNGE